MSEDLTHEEESAPKEEGAVPTEEEEELAIDDLGIDLDSLKMPSSYVLGKPNKKAELNTSNKRPVGRPKEEDEGLFAWCEQFSYAPGIDYLQLHRLHPKLWEGVNIGGFIEDIYEPIDEHWLADRWGGGNYSLTSYQRDASGRTRKTKTKTIEISGVPRNFMGEDGKLHPLPSYNSKRSNSMRSSDVLRRRMGIGRFKRSNEWDDEFDPQPQPQRKNVDAPLADAGQLYKTLQDTKKSETEALGVLREAQKDVHEQMQRTSQQQNDMYKTLLEQQKEELNRVRQEQRHSAESSSAPFREMLQLVMNQTSNGSSRDSLEALRAAHENAINSISKENARHIQELRGAHDQRYNLVVDELNRQRASYTSDIERVRNDYLEKERQASQEANRLRLEYTDKEKSAREEAFRQYQAQLEILRSQSSEMRERQRDEIASLSREKNETVTALRQDLTEMRTALLQKDHENRTTLLERENSIRTEYLERENKLHRQIDKLESGHKSDLLSYKSELKEEFEERYRLREKQLKESFEVKLESVRQTTQAEQKLAEDRTRMLSEAERRDKETQKAILENTASSKEALFEMRVQDLTRRLKDAEKVNASNFAPESNDPFEQLEKLTQIKEKLKSHGFISEDGDKTSSDDEEKPKDFLGKVMHYGPQILGPILERVDQATSTAQQQALQLQQQETSRQQETIMRSREEALRQQQQVLAEQRLREDRQAQIKARQESLLELRRQREDRFKAEETQKKLQEESQRLRENRAPVDQTPTEVVEEATEVVEAPTEVVEGPTEVVEHLTETEGDGEMEGYSKVSEFISASLKDNKPVNKAAGEIRLAKTMGMFKREHLQSILSMPFEDLVENLSQTQPSLRTPRARKYMKELLDKLR
jgi:hypothetical protein